MNIKHLLAKYEDNIVQNYFFKQMFFFSEYQKQKSDFKKNLRTYYLASVGDV